MKTLTIFTPTYNRAHTLHRVFESLLAQTVKDFQWMIIDDGSKDDTASLVESWAPRVDFPIQYYYQSNQGKHIAINRALEQCKTPYFLILDSDDSCVPHSVETFLNNWKDLAGKNDFGAVVSLCMKEDGQIDGNIFPETQFDSDHLTMTLKHHMTGEKWECWRTEVLRSFPFPENVKNAVVPESLVLNRAALKYKCRYISIPLRVYHDDGMDTSLVRVTDPSKNSLGGLLVYQDFLGSYGSFFWKNPLYFFITALKLVRNGHYQNKNFFVLVKEQKSTLGKSILILSYFWGRLICSFEILSKKNFSGKHNWVKT